jgi:hypothetical protein
VALQILKPSQFSTGLSGGFKFSNQPTEKELVDLRNNSSSNLKYPSGNMVSYNTDLHVVFPTPPFPPTNIQRSDRWSIIFWRDGSNGAKSSPLMFTSPTTADILIHSLSTANWIQLRSVLCSPAAMTAPVICGQCEGIASLSFTKATVNIAGRNHLLMFRDDISSI